MKWISNLSSKNWRNIHFTSIIVLCLVFAVGGSSVTSIVSSAIAKSFYYPFFKIRSTVILLSSVHEDNQRMQKALVEASLELTRMDEMERENNRLREVLGFEPPSGHTLIPAAVISVTGEYLPIAAVINRGSNDGIQENMTLINEQGLIGRVVSVALGSSTIQLLTDPTSHVAGRINDSREMGIVRYKTVQGMIFDNLPIQGKVIPGDIVLTSGLGGIYPAGLKVGIVERVERPEDEVFCMINLNPSVNFSSLEELFILRPVQP